jgi:hypothetical protein
MTKRSRPALLSGPTRSVGRTGIPCPLRARARINVMPSTQYWQKIWTKVPFGFTS